MSEQWQMKDGRTCRRWPEIVCCTHGRSCARDQSPQLRTKECNAVPPPPSSRLPIHKPKAPRQLQKCCQHKGEAPSRKPCQQQRKGRSYFQEKQEDDAKSVIAEAETSTSSLFALPAFSSMRIDFREASAQNNRDDEGLAESCRVNEKLHPQSCRSGREGRDNVAMALLKSLYIGCLTSEEAEKHGHAAPAFSLYHRKHGEGDVAQLLKPLPLCVLYARSSGEFRHNLVESIELDERGVDVFIAGSDNNRQSFSSCASSLNGGWRIARSGGTSSTQSSGTSSTG